MKLLLHACCGPCSLEPTRILREAGHQVSLAYVNSNIAPKCEYLRRRNTLFNWAKNEGLTLIEGVYAPALWEDTAGRVGDCALRAAHDSPPPKTTVHVLGHEARCRACYRLRLEETARLAASEGFDAVGTTLTVSPYQNIQVIHEELERASVKAGVKALFEDYRAFFKQGAQRSRALGMYAQNYCGCRFSENEAQTEREERKLKRIQLRDKQRAMHENQRQAEESARLSRRHERLVYAQNQARKRAILKQLRVERTSNT